MAFIVRITLLVLCAAASAHLAAAQETVNYASVSGRVTDPQGAVVPGARVTARQTETNLTLEAVTDREGRFRFPYLRVGPYEIQVRQQGFADVTRMLTLTVGAAFELPVSLAVGTMNTAVTVTAQATVLEAARSQIAGTVLQTEVRNLSMNGRNFLDLALLVPGVSPTNVGGTQLFAETSAVPGSGISATGPSFSRTSSNANSTSRVSPPSRPTASTPSTPGWPRSAIKGRQSRRACIPIRSTPPISWGRWITCSTGRISSAFATVFTTPHLTTPVAPAP